MSAMKSKEKDPASWWRKQHLVESHQIPILCKQICYNAVVAWVGNKQLGKAAFQAAGTGVDWFQNRLHGALLLGFWLWWKGCWWETMPRVIMLRFLKHLSSLHLLEVFCVGVEVGNILCGFDLSSKEKGSSEQPWQKSCHQNGTGPKQRWL